MPCMISFVNPEELVHKERDGFIKYGGVVKRYISVGQYNEKVSLLIVRMCRRLYSLVDLR